MIWYATTSACRCASFSSASAAAESSAYANVSSLLYLSFIASIYRFTSLSISFFTNEDLIVVSTMCFSSGVNESYEIAAPPKNPPVPFKILASSSWRVFSDNDAIIEGSRLVISLLNSTIFESGTTYAGSGKGVRVGRRVITIGLVSGSRLAFGAGTYTPAL